MSKKTMTEYIVFPQPTSLLKITASSVNVARNKYLKEFPEHQYDILIIVPTSHAQYTKGYSLEQKLYKMSLPEKRTLNQSILYELSFNEFGTIELMESLQETMINDGWAEDQIKIKPVQE